MKVTKLGTVTILGVAAGLGAGASFTAQASTAPPTSPEPSGAESLGTIPDPAACAEGLTLNDGELVIATGDPAFPPYVIDDDPESGEGFESAVAYAVAAQLGFEDDQVTWVRTTFDSAIQPGPKDFDFNLQQYSISPEREEVVSFSVPYYTSTQAIFGAADSPAADATSLADLQGLRIGVATGTTSVVFAEDIIAPDEAVQIYNDNASAVAALDGQQIDAIVADLPTALYVAFVEMDNGAVYGQFSTTDDTAGESWGLLFEKDNPLVECVNNAILLLRESGELDEITEEWMTSSVDVPFIDIDG
jgi:polar amino acid transport system substrate-binding protein